MPTVQVIFVWLCCQGMATYGVELPFTVYRKLADAVSLLGSNRPELAISGKNANGENAAEVAVPAQLIVIQ